MNSSTLNILLRSYFTSPYVVATNIGASITYNLEDSLLLTPVFTAPIALLNHLYGYALRATYPNLARSSGT